MSPSALEYLRRMLDEAECLSDRTREMSRGALLADGTLERAVVRSPHVAAAWRAMDGMCNRLIHDYFGVDYELVWDVVVDKVPSSCEQLLRIVEQGGQA